MAISDESEPTLFRWHALNKAYQIALGLAGVVASLIVFLFAYGLVVPSDPEAAGAPHAWVPIPFFPPPAPTATPIPLPTPTLEPLRIGLVAGHHGYDTGAVCVDGLTEAEINFQVAQYVAKTLELRGYHVDVLDEFDARLTGYRALLLLSIHADSCDYINDQATGFKVARVLDSKVPEAEDRLVTCLRDRYAARTGMEYHANSITPDMTSYHGFYEVAPETPSAIIEIGFMYLDRVMLTDHADVVAQGIVNGIICFLTNY